MGRLGVALLVAGCGRLEVDARAISLQLPEGGQLLASALAPDGTWSAVSQASGAFRSEDHATWTPCAPSQGVAIGVDSSGAVWLSGSQDVLTSTDRCASWQATHLPAAPWTIGVSGAHVYAGT